MNTSCATSGGSTAVGTYNAGTINRLPDGGKQLLGTKRFREEVYRAGLQGLHRHWNVTMRGDENDLDRWIRIGKLTLKIETAQSWESHVQDKTARRVRPLGV